MQRAFSVIFFYGTVGVTERKEFVGKNPKTRRRCSHAANTYIEHVQNLTRSVCSLHRGTCFQVYSGANYLGYALSFEGPTGEAPLWFCAFTLYCGFTARTGKTPNAMASEASSYLGHQRWVFFTLRLACEVR